MHSVLLFYVSLKTLRVMADAQQEQIAELRVIKCLQHLTTDFGVYKWQNVVGSFLMQLPKRTLQV